MVDKSTPQLGLIQVLLQLPPSFNPSLPLLSRKWTSGAEGATFMELRAMDMAEEKVLKFRRVAEILYTKYKGLRNTLRAPFIIAMKGDFITGRYLAAFYVASILRCPLVKEYELDNYDEKSEGNQSSLWINICSLAESQLISGRSVVIDAELADPYGFYQLKELSERTRTPLAVFEYRVDDAKKLWNSQYYLHLYRSSKILFIFDLLKKSTSQTIQSTYYDTGEIPKILVEVDYLWNFERRVDGALKDFRDHIILDYKSDEQNDCDHIFIFINIEDEYKKPCRRCSQLVWGSVYRCQNCRIIIHGTCNYFPNSLRVHDIYTLEILTLNLCFMVPELDTDASCSCCKQLLRGSSRYYSSSDVLVLFDLDCLFLLPAKVRTKRHKHELQRRILGEVRMCMECDASIDKETIFYHCYECNYTLDLYCLLLPETVDFDRHRHLFSLSIVPRADPFPYYCDACLNERDTERWVYCCIGCDFFMHPRCLVDDLPRYLNSDFTDKRSQICSSQLSNERLVAKEPYLKHRPEAEELRSSFKESAEKIELPIIITMKGLSSEGRKLVSFALAAMLDCLLIDEEDFCDVTNIANEPKQACYEKWSKVAVSHLQIGLSAVIDCDLSYESEFLILRDLAIATETPLFIIGCVPFHDGKSEEFHKTVNSFSDYAYDVGDTPMLFVNVNTPPTFDDINKFMPDILRSISAHMQERKKGCSKEPNIQSCYRHDFSLGLEYDVLEGDICGRCSKQLSTPVLKCRDGDLVFHKTCNNPPSRVHFKDYAFDLQIFGDDNNKVRCDCCHDLVKDYAYKYILSEIYLDLKCLFTPPKPRINLHEHPIQLDFSNDTFHCEACGFTCNQKLHYSCKQQGCSFKIGINCGWLKETVDFDPHRHLFQLVVIPESYYKDYFCDICQEVSVSPGHWVYGCVGCEFFMHIHCLVPGSGCPPTSESSSN